VSLLILLGPGSHYRPTFSIQFAAAVALSNCPGAPQLNFLLGRPQAKRPAADKTVPEPDGKHLLSPEDHGDWNNLQMTSQLFLVALRMRASDLRLLSLCLHRK
jgi:hypothetical protein